MSVTIVSVYPKGMQASYPIGPEKGIGLHTYKLDPAPPNGYTELVVEQGYQKVYFGENVGDRWEVVDAAAIARSLLNEWTTNMVGTLSGFGPGIFIKSLDPETFKAQLQEAYERQEGYFNWLFTTGEGLHRKSETNQITDEMRMAAKWLGRENVEWLKPFKQQLMKECPLCITSIPERAKVCPNCHRDISDLESEMVLAPEVRK